MERRALLAVVLSLLILIVYQEFVIRHLYPPPSEDGYISAPPEIPPPARPEPALREPDPKRPLVPALQGLQERRVVVETEFYRATLTSVGARLASFELKKYRTTVDPDSSFQETIVAGQDGELPFGVELRGDEVLSDAGVGYAVDGTGLTLQAGESGHVDFVGEGEAGVIDKRFVFHGDRYDFSVAVRARNVPAKYTELGVSWIKAIDVPPAAGGEILFDRTAHLDGTQLVEDSFDQLADGKILAGDIVWAGYAGRHFVAALVPVEPRNQRLWLKLRDGTVEEKLLFPLASGAIEQQLTIYIGPKELDTLEGVGHELSRSVDVGWFGFIAIPLLQILKFSHRVTANYGLDIILLTVLIKVLFIPLTQRSFKSMRAMQKLQPQMAKIRERYKDKPEQMNKEIMEMYRRHKVNPLGGCLPMLLQIPVFIGLYQALMNAVELRHAPFVLWINDLSAPDRLGSLQLPFVENPGVPVLTLLMGASMFAQQWMTPTAGDPTQQRVMMIMPLMFTFMFVNFPAGLSLYWLVNNLLTIAQQYYINRTDT